MFSDLNECDPSSPVHYCDTIPNSKCNDLIGSYECICADGYKKEILSDGSSRCDSKFLQ